MLSVEIEGGEEMRERRIISSCLQSLLVGEHSEKTDSRYSCTNSYEQIYLLESRLPARRRDLNSVDSGEGTEHVVEGSPGLAPPVIVLREQVRCPRPQGPLAHKFRPALPQACRSRLAAAMRHRSATAPVLACKPAPDHWTVAAYVNQSRSFQQNMPNFSQNTPRTCCKGCPLPGGYTGDCAALVESPRTRLSRCQFRVAAEDYQSTTSTLSHASSPPKPPRHSTPSAPALSRRTVPVRSSALVSSANATAGSRARKLRAA